MAKRTKRYAVIAHIDFGGRRIACRVKTPDQTADVFDDPREAQKAMSAYLRAGIRVFGDDVSIEELVKVS